MKVSLNWLNEYLDQPVTVDEAVPAVEDLGLPIEAVVEIETSDGGKDTMLDVEVTSNRSDCLSHIGVAREVAAGTGRKLVLPDCSVKESDTANVQDLASVENQEPELCPLYTARVIKNIKVGPSPQWMVDRLNAIGQDSINNLADITNYVQMEFGQPLHVFDYDKLAKQSIVVRKASKGEAMSALNAESYKLSEENLVIADASQPVAIAGVMGGEVSKVTEETTNILLEAATFDRSSVRSTARKLKVIVKGSPGTESSYRYERGVDPMGIELASQRAAQLILELAGGELAQGVIRAGADDPTPKAVTMRIARCNLILGSDLSGPAMVELLDGLGLYPTLSDNGDEITCVVPTFRLDLEREIDFIEEVARTRGMNEIQVRDKVDIVTKPIQPKQAAKKEMAQVLVSHGYHETITFSFVSENQGRAFLPPETELVRIEHDLRKAEPFLRPSLLPSLMVCRKANQDVGNSNVRLYETAEIWWRQKGKIVEHSALAMLADVDVTISKNATTAANQAMRALRGSVEELVENLGGVGAAADISVEPFEFGNFKVAAMVKIEGQCVGMISLIDDAAQKMFDLQTPVVAAELMLDSLLNLYPPNRTVGNLPRYPGIERDLSIVVNEPVAWSAIRSHVEATEPAMLETLEFVDTYRGKPISKGKKSVTFRMFFRDPKTTLRHEQVDPQVASVVQRLQSELKAELRG